MEKPQAKLPAGDAAPAPVERAARPKRQVLLCPGPVMTSLHVKAALARPDACHREPEFSELLSMVRAKLLHALGLGGRYTAAVVNGSGTAALESAVLAACEPPRKLLVINNGVYGSRIARIAKIHGIPLVEIRSPITERPDLNRVSAALKRARDVGTVAMVHHETSTGILNPVEEVGALAEKYRRRFLVDAISSLGAEKLDLAKAHVDFCVGSAGKALHGAPGLAFVLAAQEESARVLKLKPRSLYLDLGTMLQAQDAGDPPFTPAVPLIAAFHAALDELIREGVKGRTIKYRQRALFLRSGFKKLGLAFVLDEKIMSNSLTSLWVPKWLTYQQLHDRLKRAGYVIYAGQSELKGKIFRVAHMGGLLQSDLDGFLKSLKVVTAPPVAAANTK
ncbi:MAG: alanine--glyoxylate aminotransferase family protein [Candidatus Omnitrophica bacterium]|nr:alanine--glyoxylate aminotransferase family protein [Candidatus Omnitrophota bacterium]